MSSLTGYNPATISDAFSSGGYRHIALSISGSIHTLYLDGSAVAVNSNAGNIFSIYTSAISNLYIGCAGDLSYGYTGIIDDFRIWNRALPTSDISALYFEPGYYRLPINKLSTAAYNAMVYSGTGTVLQAGAFGTTLLVYSARNNPVIQIKKDTGGTPTNFYAPVNGTKNLTTGINGTGTGIVTFLGGLTGYVTKWYDQTGNGHDASGCTTNSANTHLPFINTATYVVDFGTNGYFSLADNVYPTGNLPYTYMFTQKNDYPTSIPNVVYFGGTSGGGIADYGKCGILMAYTSDYNDTWLSYDYYNITKTTGAVYAFTYGGGGNQNTATGKQVYINNVLVTNPTITNSANSPLGGNRIQTSVNNYLGYSPYSGTYTFNNAIPYFYWMPYQLDLSNVKILGAT